MTNQEIFDIVAAHLIKQNRRSIYIGDNRYCAYRGENGDMCAVGCLIKDEFYTPELEGDIIWDLSVSRAVAKSLSLDMLNDDTIELLSKLQRLHDLENATSSFEERLNALAIELNLTPYSVPSETF